MKHLIFVIAVASTLVSFADSPALTMLDVVQSGRRVVTISYMLENAPAVVTVDIQTNAVANASDGWASIGGENVYPTLEGDVSKVVDCGDNVYTIFWKPHRSWPDHKFVNGTARAVLTAWPTNAPPMFMAVDLREGVTSRVTYYADKSYVPGGITNRIYKTTSLLLRKIPAAGIKWKMGSTAAVCHNRSSGTAAEDQHNVTLSEDYYMAIYETTSKQHAMVASRCRDYMSLSYSCFNGKVSDGASKADCFTDEENEILPVCRSNYETLRGDQATYNWPDDGHNVMSNGFFGVLRCMTGIEFDLPTEAQWEFAARAGTASQAYYGQTTTYQWGMNRPLIDEYMWCYSNCQVNEMTVTHPVGMLKPNAFDLYDVIGNVYEACLDQEGAYTTEDQLNPHGANTGATKRIVRGGSIWNGYQYFCTSSFRYSFNQTQSNLWGTPYFGFRVMAPATAVK